MIYLKELRARRRPGVLPLAVAALLLGVSAPLTAQDEETEIIRNVPPGATLRASVDGQSAEVTVSPLEPLNFSGTLLEQMIRTIEARQQQLRTTESTQATLFQRLDQTADRHIALSNALEGNDTLVADLQNYQERVAQASRQREAREQAQRTVNDRERAARDARTALERQRGEIVVERAEIPIYEQRNGQPVRTGSEVTYLAAERGARGAVSATQELQKIERDIQRNQNLINDPYTGEAQRDYMRRHTLPPLLRHKEQIETALRAGTSTQTQAIERAEADLTASRQALQNLEAATPPSVAQWRELQARYRQAADAMRAVGARLPTLPDDPAASGTAIGRLSAARTELINQREQAQAQLNQTLGELEATDRQLIALNQAVIRMRRAGSTLARNTLIELGTPETDPVVAELQNLQSLLSEGEGMFSNFDKRLNHLERVRSTLVSNSEGAKIISGVRDRLQIVNKTLGTLKTAGETGLKVRQMLDQLQSPRTSIEGLATALELAGPLAGKVPVVGQTMGQFLGFYAKVTAAIGRQATRIQDHVMQETLRTTLIASPPERRLYTTQQVGDAMQSRLQNVEREQIENTAKRLQVRRLIALLNGQR